jgi:hypothetical protein
MRFQVLRNVSKGDVTGDLCLKNKTQNIFQITNLLV